MAKKIRFPLEMDGGIEVRDIDSLKENFSLQRVMGYLADGKLVTWLRDRYANDLADSIEELDKESDTLAKSICEIFEIPYDDTTKEDLEKAAERNHKLSILKEYTSESEYIDNVDAVAFEQDDIYDLLDEKTEKIYLCGEKFSIPLTQEGITYVGINEPVVIINSKVEVDWDEKHITLLGVKYDDKYQAVVESAEKTKKVLYEKAEEAVKAQSNTKDSKDTYTYLSGNYRTSSYINFMLAPIDKAESEKNFNLLSSKLRNIKYDPDVDIESIKTKIIDMKIVGLADNYLNSL